MRLSNYIIVTDRIADSLLTSQLSATEAIVGIASPPMIASATVIDGISGSEGGYNILTNSITLSGNNIIYAGELSAIPEYNDNYTVVDLLIVAKSSR